MSSEVNATRMQDSKLRRTNGDQIISEAALIGLNSGKLTDVNVPALNVVVAVFSVSLISQY